jgi:nucleotide-binding universal stress UspA family protein
MYQRILVPYDGSDTSTLGLQEAIQLAKLTGATLLLTHVVNDLAYVTGFEAPGTYTADLIPLMTKAGEEILARGQALATAAGIQTETALIQGLAMRVSESVAEQATAWHADLIVLGTHGRKGVGRMLLGSDAEQILRIAPVPVLLVRAKAPSAA